MAHIKVVRRSMRKDDYIRLRYSWLKRYIYENKTLLSPVMIRSARQIAEHEWDFYDEAPYELRPGDLYYSPDGSVFFTVDAEVPENMKNGRVCLYLSTTGEVIVKVNGHWAGGLDPNRDAVEITRFLGDGRLFIEMLGFNRSKPDDERNPDVMARRGCRQIFEGLYLCTVNETARSLCYDLEALTDIISSDLFDEEYKAELTERLDAALNLIDFDDFRTEDAAKAAKRIEETIYADKTFKGDGRAALVAHSHLDIAYYWRRIHTVQKNLRTVLIQLRLMDEYPEYSYTHTQPYLYETLKAYYPEVFAELKRRVAEGRFEPVGAMYVEPDCNIPCAESLIRQCLYGQRFYKENFGFTVDTAWLPDVFGNSAVLPQILRKSGVKYFVSNKMSTWNDTNRFPHNNFLWRGLDGTEIFACVPPTHFITWNEPSQIRENAEAFQEKRSGMETLQMYGYGDGGSGATAEMIELARRAKKLSVLPETRLTTAEKFLRENFTENAPLPVWEGELYLEMHRGTFTTKAALKAYNRRLEEKFRVTELLSAMSGETYPAEELRRLYKLFLLQQFHDILPGSHITPVFEDAVRDLGTVEAGLDALLPASGEYTNLTGYSREGREFLPDETGDDTRLGVRGRFVKIAAKPLSSAVVLPEETGTDWLRETENGWQMTAEAGELRFAFAEDGGFSSLCLGGVEYAAPGFNGLKLYDDKPGFYDAWDILPDYEEKEVPLTVRAPCRLTRLTPAFAEFTAEVGTKASRIVRTVRVFRGSLKIETEVFADWHESHKLLKVGFPTALRVPRLLTDTSAGYYARPTQKNTSWEKARYEVCSHKYFVLDANTRGVAVYTRNKYGVGNTEKGVSLSLLRATERPDPTADLGEHRFCYALEPLAENFTRCRVPEKAEAYNSPLTRCPGLKVPAVLSAILAEEKLSLQAVKLSEDGSRRIIRLAEVRGDTGSIALPEEVAVCDLLENETGRTKTLRFSPFEIVTIALEARKKD